MAFNQSTGPEIAQKALAHWDLVNKLASRRFHQEVIAEEAVLYVFDSLEKDNYRKLRQFGGRSKFSTFFSSVTYRLLEDFSRKKFGRLAPPKWIKEAGGIWLLLFRLLCMERFSFNEAILLAKNRTKEILAEHVESAAEKIICEVPNCGKTSQHVPFEDDESRGEDTSSASISTIEIEEKELLFSAIGQEIFGNPVQDDQKHALRKLLKQTISIGSDERVLLKLCFVENFSVTQAGKMLGLNRFQAHGRLRRTLGKIRQQFKNAGCEEELRLLLR